MITPIPLDGVVYVHATFAIDEKKLFDAGPARPLHPDTVGGTRWAEDYEIGAFRFDMYQTLRQLSFMQNGGSTHLIVWPDAPEEAQDIATPMAGGPTRVWKVPNPETAMFRFWSIMNDVANIPPVPVVAGWNIRNDMWPRLIVQSLAHGIRIDQAYRVDPLSRYSMKLLLDLAEIYLQGAYPALRRVPELVDALQLFNVQQICPVNPIVDANTMARYTPEEWCTRGFMQVINFLYGMQAILRQYYG